MSIRWRVLGEPGRDNALFAWVETGQAVHRLLFDCGEGCLAALPVADIRALDALFFSHLHLDHIAGFDSFLHHNYMRPGEPVRLFGPAGTIERLQHRLRGVLWNLAGDSPGRFRVTDVEEDRLVSVTLRASEGFARRHDRHVRPRGEVLMQSAVFQVEACGVDHGTPCLGYLVRERPRVNISPEAAARFGLEPGAWMRRLKESAGEDAADTETLEAGGTVHRLADLRRELLTITPGESLAYLTDLRLDATERDRLAAWLSRCDTLACESSYREADREHAERNRHATASEAGRLARQARAGRLVLFHVSDRYLPEGRREMLEEARAVFPRADFPEGWLTPRGEVG